MRNQLTPSEIREKKRYSIFDVRYLWSLFTSHKRWFAVSLLSCLCLAGAYIYFGRPAYSVRAKMVIIERRNNTASSAAMMLQGQLPFGLGSALNVNLGVENEKEILKSKLIARDVVNDLGLHTEYRLKGFLKKRLLYKTQPINVEVSPAMLRLLDEELPMIRHSVDMVISKTDDGYETEVILRKNKKKNKLPKQTFTKLPAVIHTELGDLKLTENNLLKPEQEKRYKKNYTLKVSIMPPMTTARKLAKITSIASASKKASYTINLDIQDESIMRGIDYLNGLIKCYNEYTNQVKRHEVERSDSFVNSRLAKIDAELDSTDSRWESSKKQFQVTDVKVDAEEVMKKKSNYESQIVNLGIQQQMLDYLGEYVNDPANLYELIPVSAIGNARDTIPLIGRHNQLVNERMKMLNSMTEQSTQVVQNKLLIDELHPALKTAILRNKEALTMQRRAVEREYDKYMSRVGSSPAQERVLTEIGRDRKVKEGVYLRLLQQREENAMELTNMTDKGRKIDETLYLKKTKPKTLAVLVLAVVLGILLPYCIFFIRRRLKNTIESDVDLRLLTKIPLIGYVSSASGSIDDSFREIRASLLHQLGEGQKAILVTSADEGDGKTVCAVCLAKAFARTGARTVLCDFNFRHPSLAKEFSVLEQTGLVTLIEKNDVSKEQIQAVVKRSDIESLDVLPAGFVNAHPADLLANKRILQVMACLREQYDIIILDGPAVGKYSDVLIDGLADATCFVCRSGRTTKNAIEKLDKLVEEHRITSPCILLR